MNALWSIAFITFKEGVRNRAFYGIAILALLLMGINPLIAGMVTHNVGKVAVDIALSAVSLAGLLLVLFIGINLIAKDLDRRTIYMVLSRPISRTQYMYGKFIGMIMLIVSATFFFSAFASLSILIPKMTYPEYFERFAWSLVFLAMAFTALMLVLLSALSMFFASFSSSSFITLILTVVSYIIGQSLGDVKALVESQQTVGIQVSTTTVKLIQTAYVLFPNLSLFDIKLQASHGLTLSFPYIAWTVSYGIVYSAMTITAAAVIFRRKEFP